MFTISQRNNNEFYIEFRYHWDFDCFRSKITGITKLPRFYKEDLLVIVPYNHFAMTMEILYDLMKV